MLLHILLAINFFLPFQHQLCGLLHGGEELPDNAPEPAEGQEQQGGRHHQRLLHLREAKDVRDYHDPEQAPDLPDKHLVCQRVDVSMIPFAVMLVYLRPGPV